MKFKDQMLSTLMSCPLISYRTINKNFGPPEIFLACALISFLLIILINVYFMVTDMKKNHD